MNKQTDQTTPCSEITCPRCAYKISLQPGMVFTWQCPRCNEFLLRQCSCQGNCSACQKITQK